MKIWTLTVYIKDEGVTGEYDITTKNFATEYIARQEFDTQIKKVEEYILKKTRAESIGELTEIDGECCTYRKRENLFECYFSGACSCQIVLEKTDLIEEIEDTGEENKFNIVIRETLEKVIEVEAPSREEAIKEVEMMYYNEEIILDAEDFASKEIY